MNALAKVDNKRITVDRIQEIVESYINSLDVKPRSKETYRKAIKHFTNWLFLKGISSTTREDILQFDILPSL